MWRRSVAIVVLASLALFVIAAIVLPGAVAGAAPSVVSMRGKAAVVSGVDVPQLRLKTTSSEGWLLEVAASPVSWSESSRMVQTLNLSGSFTLGTLSQGPIATGSVVGWVRQDGVGGVQLSSPGGATLLDMSFTIGDDDSVNSVVQGQWPALPASPPVLARPQPIPEQPVNHRYWYLSRTAAMAAYILLFINVCLGLGVRSRHMDKALGRWRALDLHQFTAILGVALVVLHVFVLLGDKYFSFSLAQLLVPLSSPYRQGWTAIGVIGFYMLLVVVLSFYLRRLIGQRAWRLLHYVSFVLFLFILFHSIEDGTDSSALWARWLYVLTGTTVVFLFLSRFVNSRADHTSTRQKAAPGHVEPRVQTRGILSGESNRISPQ